MEWLSMTWNVTITFPFSTRLELSSATNGANPPKLRDVPVENSNPGWSGVAGETFQTHCFRLEKSEEGEWCTFTEGGGVVSWRGE